MPTQRIRARRAKIDLFKICYASDHGRGINAYRTWSHRTRRFYTARCYDVRWSEGGTALPPRRTAEKG